MGFTMTLTQKQLRFFLDSMAFLLKFSLVNFPEEFVWPYGYSSKRVTDPDDFLLSLLYCLTRLLFQKNIFQQFNCLNIFLTSTYNIC